MNRTPAGIENESDRAAASFARPDARLPDTVSAGPWNGSVSGRMSHAAAYPTGKARLLPTRYAGNAGTATESLLFQRVVDR